MDAGGSVLNPDKPGENLIVAGINNPGTGNVIALALFLKLTLTTYYFLNYAMI